MITELKALIFDIDGTLSNTEQHGHRVAFNDAFAEYGIDWHWDVNTYGKLLAVTGGKERMKFYATDFLHGKNLPENLDALIPELHQAKNTALHTIVIYRRHSTTHRCRTIAQ